MSIFEKSVINFDTQNETQEQTEKNGLAKEGFISFAEYEKSQANVFKAQEEVQEELEQSAQKIDLNAKVSDIDDVKTIDEGFIRNSQTIDFNATIEDAKKNRRADDFLFADDEEDEQEYGSDYLFNLNPTQKDLAVNEEYFATEDEYSRQREKCYRIDINAKIEDEQETGSEYYSRQKEKCFEIDLNARLDNSVTEAEKENYMFASVQQEKDRD